MQDEAYDGTDQWILCQVEIQSSYETGFASRVDLYNSGLKWLFGQEVLTLIILVDLTPNWRPSEHRFELGGFESYRRFPICKVIDRLSTDWVNDNSIVVQVARAQIAALETAGDPQARYTVKTQMIRNRYTAGYTSEEVREIFRLIDWMMHLPASLGQKFRLELVAYEKELQMPHLTSIERFAKEEGFREGIEKVRDSSASMIVKQLTRVCGKLPSDLEHQVGQLPLQQFEILGEALFDFKSPADLENWLASAKP